MNYERIHFSGKNDYEWDDSHWVLDQRVFSAHMIKDMLYKGVCNFCDMSRGSSSKINGLCEAIEKKINRPYAYIYASKT